MGVNQAKPCDTEIIQIIRSKSRAGAEALYDRFSAILLLAIILITSQKEIAENAL
jgi:hypothetical protein